VEKSVLVVPGDHFGMDGYLRFGFGDVPDRLRGALDRVSQGLVNCGLLIADPIAGKGIG
jgi:Aspartate/tyrosine/aromatic aminotransferase